MPGIFGDHMVLQRGVTLPVWGTASPGEHISVTCGGQNAVTVADAAGKWRVILRPLEASDDPGSLVINGDNRIEYHDVIAGDVWLCAGGANMAMPLSEADGGREASAAGDRSLRCYFPGPVGSADPMDPENKSRGHWEVCNPDTAPSFPAVGFFFARDLRAASHLPMGIINCSSGSDAPISSWIPSGKGIPGRGDMMFRRLLAPVIPYPITGILWYQGESDEGKGAPEYRRLLPQLIRDWRARWGVGPFPFYVVSLSGFGAEDGPCVEPFTCSDGSPDRGWPWLREGTACALTLPFTGMAVATDLGVPDDRCPPDKLNVGRRFALLARHRVYGENLADEGPRLSGMKAEGRQLRLFFESGGGGLTMGLSPTRREIIGSGSVPQLGGFAVSGADRKWYPASAAIDGDGVVVCSDAVERPIAVRYNWRGFPIGNLYNKAGLPAPPFRTDSDQP